jgi:endonuclease G
VQPNSKDFVGSGYDKGTLVRISDIRGDRASVQEAYYYSAVVPQTPQSNRQTWLAVEEYTTRSSLGSGQPIWVLAGPVYRRAASGKERVLVLGEGATPVPTDLFRILARQVAGAWEIQAFVVPNDETGERNALHFVTSVAEIETLTGMDLLPKLSQVQKQTVNRSDWANAAPPLPPERR